MGVIEKMVWKITILRIKKRPAIRKPQLCALLKFVFPMIVGAQV